MLGATLTCFALVPAAAAFVHTLWGGKWDNAIPVVQLLALSLPIKMVMPLCRSLMEGRGEWRLVSTLLLADGIGTVIAGGLGAWVPRDVIVAGSARTVWLLGYAWIHCTTDRRAVRRRICSNALCVRIRNPPAGHITIDVLGFSR